MPISAAKDPSPWPPSETRANRSMTEPRPDLLTVHVLLDAGRAYDIQIGRGLIDTAGAAVAALGGRRAAIVTDATVGALYAARLRTSLEQIGRAHV